MKEQSESCRRRSGGDLRGLAASAGRRRYATSLSPLTTVIAASVLTIVLLMGLGWQVRHSYMDHKCTQKQVFPIGQLKGRIIHFDEILTMSANMAAATGDPQWEKRYRQVEPQLDAAIKSLRKLVPETFDSTAAIQTDKANVKLVDMENQVFELVGQGRLDEAQAILSGDGYCEQKKLYSDGMERIAADLEYHITADLESHRKRAMVAITSVLLGLPLLVLIWLGVLRNMRRYLKERHLAEQALKESENRFRDFFANAPIGFHIFGPNQIITDINDAELDMIGYTHDEIVGKKTWSDLIIPAQAEQFKKHWNDIITKGNVRNLEYTFIHKQGRHIDVLLNASSRFDEIGQFISSRSSILNITEHKHAERERERLLKTLAAKNEELQSIVCVASHDLKSPLVNIQGFSGELNRTCEQINKVLRGAEVPADIQKQLAPLLDEDIPESISFIRAGTIKMQALLDGLLQVCRVGSAALQIQALDMNELMKHIIASMQYQIIDSGADVTVDDLPGCIGDTDHVNQVFSNLLANAVKYLDPDRKSEIHISGRVEDGESIYCVRDNGLGIAPQHQEKVFEIFHRLEPDGGVKGEGLGLTIALRILERHEGRIWVESEPGKGSKFFVSLPTA